MNNVAIKVENLSKKYVINHERGDENFREVIIGNTKRIISSLNPFRKKSKKYMQSSREDFWALNDVNFEINKGDKVGIIGRNGAGKSTLLKVLSRITEPTTGKVHINGRVTSLLEVGTGFHPELTGRENIYLNGAILGMNRKEIKAKFDEIVAFAEVEKFLDTPVKRYSSGMYVRLAFSVAAHLESEILVVDEVLAVGDIDFQRKCLGKMGEVSKQGRTVLFVSHNLNAIKSLCNKGIYLDSGSVVKDGNIQDIINLYLNKKNDFKYCFPIQNKDVIINNFTITQNMIESDHIDGGIKFDINIDFELLENVKGFRIGVYLRTLMGEEVIRSFITDWNSDLEKLEKGVYSISISVPECLLNRGNYIIELHASKYGVINYFHSKNVIFKEVFVELPERYNLAHTAEVFDANIILKNEWDLHKCE